MGSKGMSTLMIVMALVMSSAGCSGKMKFSSKALCENAGGKYLQSTCQPGTSTKAADMCEAHGGVYLAGEDNCIIFEK
jgi:hypothetical protein